MPKKNGMIGRVKQWLGIEGVKLELLLPEEIDEQDGQISGRIQFQSMNTQQVTYIKIVFIERYSRGRGQEKLVDEYELGKLEVDKVIEIPAGQIVEVPFTLSYALVHSSFDEMERNFFLSGLAKAAKLLNRVKSEYRLEAEAKVRGTALNPFDRRAVVLK